jgi:hypothetical protein
MSTFVFLAFVFGVSGTALGLASFTQVVALKREVALLKTRS